MEFLFWFCALFVVYAYAGYPLLLAVASRLRARPVRKREPARWPTVTAVIAARNEEKNLEGRLRNLMECDYPVDLFHVVVVSDGSTDRTVEVAERAARDAEERGGPKVTVVELVARSGKAEALNAGVPLAETELVVFADARQEFRPSAIRELAANFSDPEVGAVSGELVLRPSPGSAISAEMGAYWSYEKWIRKAESRSGSVVGATGAIYAVRRELYRPLPRGTVLDDVLTPLTVVLSGYRCTFDDTAVAYDGVAADVGREWTRKVRTLAGNWQLLGLRPELLSPTRNPLWGRFLSHKVARLLVPFALLLLLIASFRSAGAFYSLVAVIQVACYGAALLAGVSPSVRSLRPANFCLVFVTLNAAVVAGLWQWLRGKPEAGWGAGAAAGWSERGEGAR